MKNLVIFACLCGLGGVILAESSSSSEENETPQVIGRSKFRQLHSLMTGGDYSKWNPRKLNQMCRLLNEGNFQLRNNRIPIGSEGQPNEQIPIDEAERWAIHKTELEQCCRQSPSFTRRICFSELYNSHLDRQCESGTHHCCQLEGQERYRCFKDSGTPLNASRSQLFNLSLAEFSHLVQKLSIPTKSNPNRDFFSTTGEVAALSRSIPRIFPESPSSRVPVENFDQNCVDPGATKLGCMQQCCSDGAESGKNISTGCPYLQCRDFERSYIAGHPDIQEKFACEFVFILCCERQYYKNLYSSSSVRADVDELD